MFDTVYEKLAESLNARGMLMPSVKCEEFYNLVSFLFTSEEAAIFTAMPVGLTHLKEIADNLDSPDLQKLAVQLETMANRGLIHIRERNGEKVYEALAFAPGILEYQMMSGIPDERHMKIATLMRDYTRTLNKMLKSGNPLPLESSAPGKQISVNKEVSGQVTIVPLQELEELIMNTEYISVGTCVCRFQVALLGRPSDKPMNNCMMLGESARCSSERGLSKRLSKEEAIKRVEEAEEAGLIHTYTNNPDLNANFLCNCYKDLCMIIRGVSKSPFPSMAVDARWVINISEDDCIGCEACIPRCQMDALKMIDGTLMRDEVRCIGCGICMRVCPTEALYLEPREAGKVPLKNTS